MRFCTAVNCMDGRVQLPVIKYLQEHFGVEYVDMITEPGPNAMLAAGCEAAGVDSILARMRISVEKHRSVGIAVVGHYDCAGNPVSQEDQTKHTLAAVENVKQRFPELPVIGLWVGEDWQVSKIVG
ncbi:MAG: hypothetical protein ISS35_07285 [Kiritimatiellae bacterium]|nr:hypothetical protein [Kiritimatiellia bacterium]